MLRRPLMPLVLIAFVAASLTMLAGCQSAAKSRSAGVERAAPRPAAINHLAFFMLKNEADVDELIADCDTMLATIPGVVSYYCGRHLDAGRGERVDSNYHVGFYVGFDSEAAYAAYVEHPRHKALVAKWEPRWQWIRVLDVQDATP